MSRFSSLLESLLKSKKVRQRLVKKMTVGTAEVINTESLQFSSKKYVKKKLTQSQTTASTFVFKMRKKKTLENTKKDMLYAINCTDRVSLQYDDMILKTLPHTIVFEVSSCEIYDETSKV